VSKLLTLSDILRFALTVLRERRLRAILTIIGISIGPAAMVTIIGTAQGYSNTIINQLELNILVLKNIINVYKKMPNASSDDL